MGLEVFGYLNDLVTTNPDGHTDGINKGDDHIRGLKVTLKNTFPGANGNGYESPIVANEEELNRLENIRDNVQNQLDALSLRISVLEQ